MKHLKAIDKLTPQYLRAGEEYLTVGYQNLARMTQSDGSYAFWSHLEGEESIWLTAYVAKLLSHVKEFIAIDDKIIVNALNNIKSRQQADGSYVDKGYSYYRATLTQYGVPLTAFITIAFLENKAYHEQYKATIDKSVLYLDSKMTDLKDNFALAIATYALALKKHPEVDSYLDQLKKNAIIQDDKMFWYRELNSINLEQSPSINVEIAAYAVMAFVTAKRAHEAVPIMNWLMTQRNDQGGFYNSIDTVVGIQAISILANEFYTQNTEMNIKLSYEKGRRIYFGISQKNATTLQYKRIEKDARRITINAIGTGFAYFQMSYRYNTIFNPPPSRFHLTVAVQPNSNANMLTLKICVNYIVKGDEISSKMTLIEIFLPSGFVYDPDTAGLVKAAGVKVSYISEL